MSMNGIADIEDYDSFNFHSVNKFEQSRPLQITTQAIVYKLSLNEKGVRQFVHDKQNGKPIATPRSLLMLCVNRVINDDRVLKQLNEKSVVSSNIFYLIFKEATQFGEFSLIAHLISIWPSNCIRLADLISTEVINNDTLSKPLFSCGPTILDYVLLGLLISRPESRLKTVDFTGFHKDLKLTRDISHLSLLWLRPENRTYQYLHDNLKTRCGIFLNK
jgi:hypothetical protein